MKIINLTPHEVRIVKPDGIEKVIMENHLEEYFYGPNWNDQMIEAE